MRAAAIALLLQVPPASVHVAMVVGPGCECHSGSKSAPTPAARLAPAELAGPQVALYTDGKYHKEIAEYISWELVAVCLMCAGKVYAQL